MRVRWAAIGAAIAVTLGGGALGVVRATSSSGERAVFVPIAPCRLFDTRASDNIGSRSSPIGVGETFTQQVHGTNGNCTVPSDAVGVAMNVTTVNGTAASFLTIWPEDAAKPLASSLNWIPGAPPTPNKVDVKLSATGAISLFNKSGSVDVLADVVGYYVDHNHDDRYYTKSEVYSKAELYSKAEIDNYLAELDSQTVRMSANPSNMIGLSEHDVAVFRPINGINWCVTVESDIGIAVLLPLEMPIGAHLLGIDIEFFDGNTAQQYTATLYEYSQDALSFFPAGHRGSTTGGSATGGLGAIVEQHLTVNAETVVDEGDVFNIRFEGLPGVLEAANGVCSVTIEYEQAP